MVVLVLLTVNLLGGLSGLCLRAPYSPIGRGADLLLSHLHLLLHHLGVRLHDHVSLQLHRRTRGQRKRGRTPCGSPGLARWPPASCMVAPTRPLIARFTVTYHAAWR